MSKNVAEHSSVATQNTALVAAIDRLGGQSRRWGSHRLVDEGLDIVRDYCWAGACALYDHRGGAIELVGHRPALDTLERVILDEQWFPWGLAPMSPERFIFVEDAGRLPATPGGSIGLADLGVSSCAHLPILERDRPLGYMQIFWNEPRLVWDDETGSILRTLGRMLLESLGTRRH